MTDNIKISSKITAIRQSLNQKLAEFARNLEIPRSTLVSYENGTTVPAELLSRIVSKYGVSEEWLLSDMGPIFKINEQDLLLNGEKNRHEEARTIASSPLPDTPADSTMVVYQDFAGRVKELRSHFNMNQAEFAALMKTHGSTISDFESGNRVPSKEFIITLSEIGVSTDWFLTGTGSMLKPNFRLNDDEIRRQKAENSASPLPDTPSGSTIETARRKPPGVPLVYEGDPGLDGGIVIPLLENSASAGYGAELGEDDAPARYVRVPQFLAKYPHLASLPVKGDSMEPTLHDGDLVVCDGGGWDGDGIYVLKTFETAYIKRVQLTSKGYEVISDNKMYQSFTESAESLSIVGKVRAILVIVPGRRGGV